MSKETTNLKLFQYDPETDIWDTTTFNIKQCLNDNWDKIDEEFGNTTSTINNIEKELLNYSSYASSKESNGVYTIVQYKRNDTVYMKSTLSNADSNGNYRTNTWQFYNEAGDTIIKTITWSITYDSDNKIVSKVVA